MTDTVILGEPFLRQFVTTFDYEKNQVYFQLNSLASGGPSSHFKMSGGGIFAIVVSSLALVGLCVFGIRKMNAKA